MIKPAIIQSVFEAVEATQSAADDSDDSEPPTFADIVSATGLPQAQVRQSIILLVEATDIDHTRRSDGDFGYRVIE